MNLSWLSLLLIGRVVRKDLKFRKVCARRVPKQLSLEHKNKSFRFSLNSRSQYVSEENFLENIITCDKTWMHYNTPETKRQSMVWKHTDSLVARKFKQTLPTKNIMAKLFWDCKGFIFVEFLEWGQTINAARYIQTLKQD